MPRKIYGGHCCKMKAPFLGLLLLTASCQTFVLRDGRKYRQFAPVKDKSSGLYDTTVFIRNFGSANSYA